MVIGCKVEEPVQNQGIVDEEVEDEVGELDSPAALPAPAPPDGDGAHFPSHSLGDLGYTQVIQEARPTAAS